MADSPETRLRVPATAKAGDVIAIKTLISHSMQSGYQKDATGKTIPREIINTFACSFEGVPIFKMDLNPSISANPFIAFNYKVTKSGTFEFTWTDDSGAVYKDKAQITVS